MKASIAQKIEILFPITAEQLSLQARALPPLEANDAIIALVMIGELAARTGRTDNTLSLAIISGIKRCGNTRALLNKCMDISSLVSHAAKATALQDTFGASHTRIGAILVGANSLHVINRTLKSLLPDSSTDH